MTGRYVLPGGLECKLLAPHMPGVPDYHVLVLDRPADGADLDELARLAARLGRVLGADLVGDPGAFSVIVNGACVSRREWAHAHIIPARNSAGKRRAFAFLCFKGPLRRLERLALRGGS